MACSNSNCNTPSCGCSGTYVVSQTCPPACSEVFNSSCIVYTGVDISCLNVVTGIPPTVISRNDYLDSALTKIVNFFCGRVNEALTSTIVTTTSAPYLSVTPSVSGAVTTFTVDLDVSSLPTASVVTGGANAVVTGTGAALDPYVVNANESVVAVDSASALTLVVDPSTPGPYETTYTIGIDASLLPVTELETDYGHIFITAIPNTPNTGDTTYNLEVSEVTITSIDAKLDVVNTAAGNVAPFERTFTVDVNETEMGNYVMDTAAGILAQGGIIADPGSGITVGYDALTHTITIGESIGVPFQWQTISDGTTDEIAASPNDKLRIVADAVANGISSTLAAGPGANEATFTLVNEDRGSAQNIFGTIDCNNGGPSVGTCLAGSNIDTLTLVGGDDITLGVTPTNVVTINNDIDHVYSDVVADAGGPLQAGTTTSTLEILGGDRMSTSGALAANAEVTINFDGVAIGAGLTGSGTTADPLVADGVTLSSAGGTESLVNDGVGPTLATKGITAGSGISLSSDAVSVTITADVTRDDSSESSTAVTAGATEDLNHVVANAAGVLETYVQVRIFALSSNAGFVSGDDITSDCRIKMVSAGAYQVTTTTYTGDIKALVLG